MNKNKLKNINDKNQVPNNNCASKFVQLNFNLKNQIFCFLPVAQQFTDLMNINKKFTLALNNSELIQGIKNNMKTMLTQISFDNNKNALILKKKLIGMSEENKSQLHPLVKDLSIYFLHKKFQQHIKIKINDTLLENEKKNFFLLS